jgi:hypothetical protein
MNKTKRVAWKRHRIKRKKYEQKLKQQQRTPSGSLAARH